MNKDFATVTRLRRTLRTLAAVETGFSVAEVSGYTPAMLGNTIANMIDAGELHRGKLGHRTVRYFADPRHALVYAHSRSKIPTTITRTRAPWPADSPVHLPVDANGRPLYKVTIAPTPERALRTNTHSKG